MTGPCLLGFSSCGAWTHELLVAVAHIADAPPLSCGSRSLPATVPVVPEASQNPSCNSWSFRGCFVIFKVFNVIFVQFLNVV